MPTCMAQKNLAERFAPTVQHLSFCHTRQQDMCCSQQGQIFHHLVHSVPKAKSRHHHSWWDPAEGGWRSNIPWHHIWQEADLETAHCQGRRKSQTQDGYSSQTCGYHLGSKRESTYNSVPGNSQTPPRVWLHSVVNHSKDQSAGPWQGPEPDTPSDHWSNAIHSDHRNGEVHRSPTSWSTEGRQEHDAGRKVQVLDKPSHENQAGRSHQESAEKKQFCPWEQEAEPPVSRQTVPEHTSLLPTRHARALGIGHNWHQGPYHSPFPL